MTSRQKWKREDRGWPRYLPGGRIRTSTAALLIAFVALFWVYQNYEPPPKPSPAQVVPPGFIPDPSYTWVPRTDVERRTTTTTTTPTTTTERPPRRRRGVHDTDRVPDVADVADLIGHHHADDRAASAGQPHRPTPPSTPVPGQGPMSTPAAPTQ